MFRKKSLFQTSISSCHRSLDIEGFRWRRANSLSTCRCISQAMLVRVGFFHDLEHFFLSNILYIALWNTYLIKKFECEIVPYPILSRWSLSTPLNILLLEVSLLEFSTLLLRNDNLKRCSLFSMLLWHSYMKSFLLHSKLASFPP